MFVWETAQAQNYPLGAHPKEQQRMFERNEESIFMNRYLWLPKGALMAVEFY